MTVALFKHIEWFEKEWVRMYKKHFSDMKPYEANDKIYRKIRKNIKEANYTDALKKDRLDFLKMYKRRWAETAMKHNLRMEDPKINKKVTSKLFREFKNENLLPKTWSMKTM